MVFFLAFHLLRTTVADFPLVRTEGGRQNIRVVVGLPVGSVPMVCDVGSLSVYPVVDCNSLANMEVRTRRAEDAEADRSFHGEAHPPCVVEENYSL